MGNINRFPGGFLDLLQSTVGGTTPPVTSDFVQPTLRMDPFYEAQLLAGIRFSTAHTATNTQVVIEVPQGELWLLRALSARVLMPLTTDIEVWSFRIQEPPRGTISATTGAFPSIFEATLQSSQANQLSTDSKFFEQPLPLAAGTNIVVNLDQRDANASRTTLIQGLLTQFKT